MTFEANILSKHAPLIKEYYQAKLSEIETTIAELRNQSYKINEFLSSLTGDNIQDTNSQVLFDGYNSSWSLIDKSIFIIKNYGDSTLLEIANKIKEVYEKDIDFAILKNNLSAVLSVDAKKYNKLKRYRNEAKKWVYGVNDLK